MNDVLLTGDLHLHERSEFGPSAGGTLNQRLQDGLNILDQIVNVVKKRNLQGVIFLGDMAEQKDRLPSSTLVTMANKLRLIKEAGATIIVLMGNHDYRLKDFSYLHAISGNGLFDLVSEPKRLSFLHGHFGFIPYYRRYEQFVDAWHRLHDMGQLDWCLFHQELPGADYKFPGTIPGSFDLPLQDGCHYFSGHIHQPVKVFNRVQYVGSPYQCHFGEAGEEKFVWLLDTENKMFSAGSLQYPEYINRHYSLDFPQQLVANNYVKLIGEIERNNLPQLSEIKAKILALGARYVTQDVRVMRVVKKTSFRIHDKNDAGMNIPKYVESLPVSIKRGFNIDKLVTIGQTIFKEACK